MIAVRPDIVTPLLPLVTDLGELFSRMRPLMNPTEDLLGTTVPPHQFVHHIVTSVPESPNFTFAQLHGRVVEAAKKSTIAVLTVKFRFRWVIEEGYNHIYLAAFEPVHAERLLARFPARAVGNAGGKIIIP